MKLTKEVLESSRKWETHFLIINPKIIEENYRRIRESFKKTAIYYAIKANPDPGVLGIVKDIGCGFEVASINELMLSH